MGFRFQSYEVTQGQLQQLPLVLGWAPFISYCRKFILKNYIFTPVLLDLDTTTTTTKRIIKIQKVE